MMQAALSNDDAELGPILVDPSPATREVAEANLLAFSNERRADNAARETTEGLMAITQIPR